MLSAADVEQRSVTFRDLDFAIGLAVACLDAALNDVPKRGQNQIVDGGDGKEFEHKEFLLDQNLRAPKELLHRDHRGDGCGLQEAVHAIAERQAGVDDPQKSS